MHAAISVLAYVLVSPASAINYDPKMFMALAHGGIKYLSTTTPDLYYCSSKILWSLLCQGNLPFLSEI